MEKHIEKICVSPILSISETIKVLNDGQLKIVLIVDPDVKLLGVVTDSDIRRAILNGISFDLPINTIMKKDPIVATPNMDDKQILSLMKKTGRYEIPIIDYYKKVVDLKSIDLLLEKKQNAEVVIMAGGLGTRLKPLTDIIPKPLVKIGGKSILFTLLDQLIMAGFQKISLTINYKADMIKEAILSIPAYSEVVTFVEEIKRMGTAGSLALIDKPSSSFLVMNADLLTNVDFSAMLRYHEMEKNQITIAAREEFFQIPFGVLNLDDQKVVNIQEKPAQTLFVNAGIYVIEPEILDQQFKNTFYDMTDLINDSIASGKKVGSFPIHEYWIDIGRHEDLQQALKKK